MILATKYTGDQQMRSFGDSTVPSWYGSGRRALAYSGERVSLDAAAGLPAVAAAIRLVSEMVASFYLGVFEGRSAERRERLDTWQGRLLDMPADMPRFDWKADLSASLESCGNALAYKHKTNGQVVALTPLDVDRAAIYRHRETGEKLFDVRVRDGKKETLSTSEVLHLRGFTLKGGIVGHSPIALHRHALGAALARERFEGRYFKNHARPDVAVVFPAGVSREQASAWREEIDALHGGGDNFGKPIPLGGGADIKTIPISMVDAQFIEAKRFTVEEIARIFRVPASLLDATEQSETMANAEQRALQFLTFSLRPRLIRFEDALKADADLFGMTTLYPEFVTDSMLYVDAKSRAEVELREIQSGLRLRDEIRGDHGWGPLPPIPDDPTQKPGSVPLLTPVGAGENPTPMASGRALPTPSQRELVVVNLPATVDTTEIAGGLREIAQAHRQQKPASVTVLPASITVEQPDIRVEPSIYVDAPVLPDAAPVTVHATLEVPQSKRTVVVRRDDGSESTYETEDGL